VVPRARAVAARAGAFRDAWCLDHPYGGEGTTQRRTGAPALAAGSPRSALAAGSRGKPVGTAAAGPQPLRPCGGARAGVLAQFERESQRAVHGCARKSIVCMHKSAHPLGATPEVLRMTRVHCKGARLTAQPLATRHDAAVARPRRLLPLRALAARRRRRARESGGGGKASDVTSLTPRNAAGHRASYVVCDPSARLSPSFFLSAILSSSATAGSPPSGA
jgi:hypothetical protein